MEEKNQKRINIEEEDVISVIRRIKKITEKNIILVIPSNSAMLQNVINLKLLKKTSEELGKNISIIKTDNESNKRPVSAAGISVAGDMASDRRYRNLNLPNSSMHNINIHRADRLQKKGGDARVKMFDIIKKVDQAENATKRENTNFEKKESKVDRSGYFKQFNEKDRNASGDNFEVKKVVLLPSIISKLALAFIVIAIIVASVILYFTLPKVEINLKLESQALVYDLNLDVDKSMDKIDVDKKKIPAKEEEVSGEASETFPTTGKKHITDKASGKITIYNEFSSGQQPIVQNTRFLSKEGLIFKVNEPVIIPGFTRIEGKDIPGEVTVTVYADKDGEKYNIGAASFTLPGFQGTARYSSIYARSTQAMTGGIDKEAMFLTEGDYITAKEKLTKLAKEKNNQNIQDKSNDESIKLDKTRKEKAIEVVSNVKVGDIADSFKMTVSAKESILSVSKKDIDEFVDWKVNSETGGNVEILGNGRGYEIQEAKKDKDGNIILPINISQNVVVKIDVDKIKKDIYGKNDKEVQEYFNNMKEVRGKVIFSWTNKVPSSNDKISITIEK